MMWVSWTFVLKGLKMSFREPLRFTVMMLRVKGHRFSNSTPEDHMEPRELLVLIKDLFGVLVPGK